MLERVKANTIGAVMNKVRASSGAYSYGYGNSLPSPNGHPAKDRAASESERESHPAET